MILALLACGGAEPSPRFVEEWELMVLPQEPGWIDLRFTQDNLGWWRGGGQVRGELAWRDTPLLRLGLDGRPEQVERLPEGLRVASDRLEGKEGRWEIQLLEGEDPETRDLRAVLSRRAAGPRLEQPGWSMEVLEVAGELHGALATGTEDRLLEGRGVVLHRWGESPLLRGAEEQRLIVLGPGLSLGYERVGGAVLAWAFLEGVELPVGEAALAVGPQGRWELDFRPSLDLVATVRPVKPAAVGPVIEGLVPGEAALARLWLGEPTRGLSRGLAEVKVAGEARSAHAILGWVEY